MRNGSAELSKTPPQSKSTHRAKREIKRRVKPDARGLVGSRGKAPAELEAEPHSATADQAVQSVLRRISKSVIKQSSVGEQTLHRLYYILIQTHPAKSASNFAAVEFWLKRVTVQKNGQYNAVRFNSISYLSSCGSVIRSRLISYLESREFCKGASFTYLFTSAVLFSTA